MNTTQETFAPMQISKPTDRPTGSNVNPIIGEILDRHFGWTERSPIIHAHKEIARVTAESNARIEKNKELLKP